MVLVDNNAYLQKESQVICIKGLRVKITSFYTKVVINRHEKPASLMESKCRWFSLHLFQPGPLDPNLMIPLDRCLPSFQNGRIESRARLGIVIDIKYDHTLI
jgi:hypothetical protein